MADVVATSVIKVQGAGGGAPSRSAPTPIEVYQKVEVCSFALGSHRSRRKEKKPKETRLPTDPSSLLEMAGEITETGELYSPYVSFTHMVATGS